MLASLRSSLSRVPRPAAVRCISSSTPLRNDSKPNEPTTNDGLKPTGPTSNDGSNPTGPPPMSELTSILSNVGEVTIDSPLTDQNPKHKWRKFTLNEILTPNDLTREKCIYKSSYRRPPIIPPPAPVTRYNDIFRQLNLDPMDFSLNPSVLFPYISEMGKIYGRNVTGLSSRNQRKLGKAIRRARMIGVLPQFSRPTRHWVTSIKKLGR